MWQYAVKRLLTFVPVFVTVIILVTYLAWEHMHVVDAHLTKSATIETRIEKMKELDLISNEMMNVWVSKKGGKKQLFHYVKHADYPVSIGTSKRNKLMLKGSGIDAFHAKLVFVANNNKFSLKKYVPAPKKAKPKKAVPKKEAPKKKEDAPKKDGADKKEKPTKDAAKKDTTDKKVAPKKDASKKDATKKDAADKKKEATKDAAKKEASKKAKKPKKAKKAAKKKKRRKRRRRKGSKIQGLSFDGTLSLVLWKASSKVLINGQPAKKGRTILKAGDTLKIGDYTLEFKLKFSHFWAVISRNLRKVAKTLRFDFGDSLVKRKSATDIIMERAPASLALTLPALIISSILGIFIGLLAAFYRGTWIDRGLVLTAVIGMSISSLVYIIVLQNLLAFELQLFYVYGYGESAYENMFYLILPIIIQVLVSLGYNARFYRTVMVEESTQDYVVTAYAKGVSKPKIIFVHILRNALIPVITRVFASLPFLFLGGFLLEMFFGIPGLGKTMINSLTGKVDPPIIIGASTVLCALYIFCLIATDLLYAVADPRVRLD